MGRVENIVGNGENAGYHYVFKRLLSQGHWKSGLCGKEFTGQCKLDPFCVHDMAEIPVKMDVFQPPINPFPNTTF